MFALVLGGAVLLRVLVSLAYRPGFLFQSDAYVYMRRAVEMEPSHHRPILYSLFLKPFLALHSVVAAVTVQHLLVVGLIVLMFVFLLRLGVPSVFAAIGVAPLALDAYQLDVEHYVLAEALFQVFAAGAFVVLMWRARTTIALACAGGALLGLSGTTRFLGVTLIPIAALYVWRRGGWRTAAALLGCAAVPLLLYAGWFASHTGTFALSDRGGHFLYGRVAVIADCDDLDVPSYQRVLCDDRPVPERENPNFYVFSDDSPALQVNVPDGMTLDEVLRSYSRAVITQQPLRYLATVGSGFAHYFSPMRSTGAHDNRLDHWRFPSSADHAQPQAFLVRTNEGSPPEDIDEARFTVQDTVARGLRWYQRWAYTHGPLLALSLIAAVAGVIVRRPDVTAETLALVAAGVALLLVPVATVTFDYRFMLLSLPFLPTAAVLGATGNRSRSIAAGPRVDPA